MCDVCICCVVRIYSHRLIVSRPLPSTGVGRWLVVVASAWFIPAFGRRLILTLLFWRWSVIFSSLGIDNAEKSVANTKSADSLVQPPTFVQKGTGEQSPHIPSSLERVARRKRPAPWRPQCWKSAAKYKMSRQSCSAPDSCSKRNWLTITSYSFFAGKGWTNKTTCLALARTSELWIVEIMTAVNNL